MDRITEYQQTISSLIEEYQAFLGSAKSDIRDEILIDKDRNHFQLVSIGWDKQKFVYHVALHIDIINGHVWIQQNNTDFPIADELNERGIPKSDIVLGFQPKNARQYTGFATA